MLFEIPTRVVADLLGRRGSYAVAGLAAAIVAGAQIVGGALVPHVGRIFRTRTTLLLTGSATSAAALALIGLASNFVAALTLMGLWAVVFAATMPVRQAFINGLIPSEERATVLRRPGLRDVLPGRRRRRAARPAVPHARTA